MNVHACNFRFTGSLVKAALATRARQLVIISPLFVMYINFFRNEQSFLHLFPHLFPHVFPHGVAYD